MLPVQCRWIDSDNGKRYLHYHYRCVAVVYPDGRTWLQGWGLERYVTAGSKRLAVRMVERWACARAAKGWPG